jgi:hypothetical protein
VTPLTEAFAEERIVVADQLPKGSLFIGVRDEFFEYDTFNHRPLPAN